MGDLLGHRDEVPVLVQTKKWQYFFLHFLDLSLVCAFVKC